MQLDKLDPNQVNPAQVHNTIVCCQYLIDSVMKQKDTWLKNNLEHRALLYTAKLQLKHINKELAKLDSKC